MKPFNPKNWYWKVGGSTTDVYSSASGGFVDTSDATYVAWCSDGTLPTNIASNTELGEVLSTYFLRPVDVAVLAAYQDAQAKGLTIDVVAKVLLWLINEVKASKDEDSIDGAGFREFVKELM